MIHFGLSDEHRMLREALRAYVQREVVPLARRGEETKTFPRELIPKLAAQGYIGMKYPVERGGQGLDILAECILVEELTRAAAGVSAGVFAHSHLGIAPIVYFGTDAQIKQYAAPAIRGEAIAGFALTEPGAGSDVKGIQTRAKRIGEKYVVNGAKVFTTNGTIADYLIVAAYTRPELGANGISIFIVDTNTPGITRAPLKKLGNWSSDTAEIAFVDAEVSAENRLGPEEGGFKQLMWILTEGRIVVAARAVALAELAYEKALAYARERRAFGRPIGSFQGIGFKLARMSIDIDAARLLTYRAAHLSMNGEDCRTEASKAKYCASTVAQRVTTEALHVHGGYGYTAEYEVERLYRDAPESVIGEGTAEIQLRIISKSLGLTE